MLNRSTLSDLSDDASLQSLLQAHPLALHVPMWSAHILRLRDATAALHRTYPETWTKSWSIEEILASQAVQDLSHALQTSDTPMLRASVRIHATGTSRTIIAPMSIPPPSNLIVRLDTQPVWLRDAMVLHKTDARDPYDAARARVHGTLSAPSADPNACFDVLLWHTDEAGVSYITESSIANVIVELPEETGPMYYTPPFSALLPGLLIQGLVHEGVVHIQPLPVEKLRVKMQQPGAQLWLCNAVRGMFAVSLETS